MTQEEYDLENYECGECGDCWESIIEPDTNKSGEFVCENCEGKN